MNRLLARFEGLQPQEGREIFWWGVGLFAYGAIVHVLLLRLSALSLYPSLASPSLLNHPLVNLGLAVLGGTFLTVLTLPLVRRSRTPKRTGRLFILVTGAFAGGLAMIAAIQVLLLFLGLYSAAEMRSSSTGLHLSTYYWLAMIDIETYGLVSIYYAMPFGLLSGLFVAGILVSVRRPSLG